MTYKPGDAIEVLIYRKPRGLDAQYLPSHWRPGVFIRARREDGFVDLEVQVAGEKAPRWAHEGSVRPARKASV